MPAVGTPNPPATNARQAQAAVPFLSGSYEYSEPMSAVTVTPGAASQDFVINITPGGFLRGVTLGVSTVTAGSGLTPVADAPWALFSALSIESIDGTPILYPIPGYSAYLVQKYCQPWWGDPAGDPTFVNSATALNFHLRFFNELRQTIGVLPNTDARAQYRLRFTIAPSNQIWSAVTTAPVLQITPYLETWAQPEAANAANQPIIQVPDGLAYQRFISHQIFPTVSGDQTFQSNRVGNLCRTFILVFRNSSGARVNVTPALSNIRWRKDNAQILVETPDRRNLLNSEFFYPYNNGTADAAIAPPTGVYVYNRWFNVGDRIGQPWLDTSQATYLQWEFSSTPGPGTLEIITEDLAPTVPPQSIPGYLMGL